MVAQCDEGVQSALDSQTALSQQLDRVARELQAFLGSSQIPSLSPYAQKLADVRQRLTVANATLLQVQARLAKIEAVAEKLQRAGVATPRFSSSNELREEKQWCTVLSVSENTTVPLARVPSMYFAVCLEECIENHRKMDVTLI